LKFRFYVALWAGKILLFIYKLMGKEKDDMPGWIMYKLCPKFLSYVHKPKYTVAVSGTNGKTTTASLINDVYQELGIKTSFNPGGHNLMAGHCMLMARSVSFLNKPIVDAAVFEADETSSFKTMGQIKPDAYIVTNICRDSLRRNGHPLFIRDYIQKALDMMPDTQIYLNADDPLSCHMQAAKQPIYFGIEKTVEHDPTRYRIQEYTVCPKCHAKPVYLYSHFIHLGKVVCPNCGYGSPDADFLGVKVDSEHKTMEVKEPAYASASAEAKEAAPAKISMSSGSLFNAFNYLAVYAYFRTVGAGGLSKEEAERVLSKVKVPKSRETRTTVKGIEVVSNVCKGQTGSSCSVVFSNLAEEKENLELVFFLNEEYVNSEAHETISWYYDADFEFLNRDHIKRIIVGGENYADYELRFRMAGIPAERTVCIPDESKLLDYVTFDGIDRIYVLYETDWVQEGLKLKEEIVEKLKNTEVKA